MSDASESLTAYQVNEKTYELQRYPYDKQSQLRAWDAADSYLLNLVTGLEGGFERLCIVHDNFGALTLPLLEYQPICYGDSWMSLEATKRNFSINSLHNELDFETDLEELVARSESPDLVIGRVPKSKSQLAYLLARLSQWVAPNCVLMLAGMDKHLSKGQFDLLEKHFGPASFLPGVKKARVWKAAVDKARVSQSVCEIFEQSSGFALPQYDLHLKSLPNVFSNDHLDIGSRFFLEQFSALPACEQVADLACGNGVLGLAYLKYHSDASVHFYDESFQAVYSAQYNLNLNVPAAKAEFVACDGLKKASASSLDLILCNPPFHQQNTVSTSIARAFFKDSKRALTDGGELWIVANRHLGYHSDLKRIFGHFEHVAANKKFVVLKAKKVRLRK